MATMKIILREDIEKLGKVGQVFDVRCGYFRNFLFPKGLAWKATPDKIQEIEKKLQARLRRVEKERARATELAGRIQGLELAFREKAGDEGKLFGSVTPQDIQQALLAKGFELDRRQVLLEEPIKTIGAHEATVRIFQDIAATVRIMVEPE